MKKLLLLLLLAVFCISGILAKPVPEDIARKVATNFFLNISGYKAGDIKISKCLTERYNNNNSCYIFHFQTKGFVIVAADDAVIPILGYSFEEQPEDTEIHPALAELLKKYSIQIDYAAKQDKTDEDIAQYWEDILNNNLPQRDNVQYGKLSTKWGQKYPYNKYTPSDQQAIDGCNKHCPAGCVAVAMAQVMKYHECPATYGQGTSSYTHPVYGYLYANHQSTLYAWPLMPNYLTPWTPSAYVNQVARLIYHCGVAGEMNYGPNCSTMGVDDAADAMDDHFYYNNCQVKTRFAVDSDWINYLKDLLDDDLPILYRGMSHMFVLDNYDVGKTTIFHVNWGWAGLYDGWFTINNLAAGGHNFNGVWEEIILYTPAQGKGSTGISEDIYDLSDKVNLYPNPNNGKFYVNLTDNSADKNISISDITGRVVFQENNINNNISIDLSGMNSGVYMVKIYNDTECELQKIIVQ